jgi:hypothetical protein
MPFWARQVMAKFFETRAPAPRLRLNPENAGVSLSGMTSRLFPLIALLWFMPAGLLCAAGAPELAEPFPRALSSYGDTADTALPGTIIARAKAEPFNLVATVIFLLAIAHTFMTERFRRMAHHAEQRHHARLAARRELARLELARHTDNNENHLPDEVSFKAQMLHFLGEVEAVFGIWALGLAGAIFWFKGWDTVIGYIGHAVNFTEPMFVVVIMALASTRPILWVAERGLRAIASLGQGSAAAWWLTILIVAPLLGSFITEPAAMTIAAMLLGRQFYALKPSRRLAYATIGLLFVNVSVGGTLTHFAAPPVLMVAAKWDWGMAFMLAHFGWKAALGIAVSTTLYFMVFRKEFAALNQARALADAARAHSHAAGSPVPVWIVTVQLGFMAWTVLVAHYPALFVGGFLFFLAFSHATAHHQGRLDLRPPMLVGFFLAGLVIHGGLQGWWIEPVLSRLGEFPLFAGATALTAFNDNAAITYLATLVPDFTDGLKYAVVAGAVTGGGLTLIANAPNPAGQALLKPYFPHGVAPVWLLLGALLPTLVQALVFQLL